MANKVKRFGVTQRALALWAADCAEHVLGLFEAQRPRRVIAPLWAAC